MSLNSNGDYDPKEESWKITKLVLGVLFLEAVVVGILWYFNLGIFNN